MVTEEVYPCKNEDCKHYSEFIKIVKDNYETAAFDERGKFFWCLTCNKFDGFDNYSF
jgi:hypothetical protein